MPVPVPICAGAISGDSGIKPLGCGRASLIRVVSGAWSTRTMRCLHRARAWIRRDLIRVWILPQHTLVHTHSLIPEVRRIASRTGSSARPCAGAGCKTAVHLLFSIPYFYKSDSSTSSLASAGHGSRYSSEHDACGLRFVASACQRRFTLRAPCMLRIPCQWPRGQCPCAAATPICNAATGYQLHQA